MFSVNDGKPAFKGNELYWRRAKKTVIAFSAVFAVSIIGTLPAQAAEQAHLSSGAKPVHAKVLEFAGRLADLAKESVGAKCDQLAGDPDDSQKSGAGVPFGQIESGPAEKACKQAVEMSPLARYQYQFGRALEKAQQYPAAVDWYGRAAEQGYVNAQVVMGIMHFKGKGVSQDYAEAMKWYRKAAEQGDARAQGLIGAHVCRGRRCHPGLRVGGEMAEQSGRAGKCGGPVWLSTYV
ncbi:MAG: tetratricopeptide repeat protein [Gammaproteobacteria bacterium]